MWSRARFTSENFETRLLLMVPTLSLMAWVIALLLVRGESFANLDNSITSWIYLGESPFPFGLKWVADIARDITSLGSLFVVALFALLATIWSLKKGDRSGALYVLITVAGGALLSTIFKEVFLRPRPELSSLYIFGRSPSFPSGHSVIAAAFYPALAVLVARYEVATRVDNYLLPVAIFVATLIAFSRVILGAHYFTDVLEGATIGFAWSGCCRLLLRRLDYHKRIIS